MKYICNVCGQIIDNDQVCPFCGCGAKHISPYETEEDTVTEETTAEIEDTEDEVEEIEDDEETSTEGKVFKCFNCGHDLTSNEGNCPFCGADRSMIFEMITDEPHDMEKYVEHYPEDDEPKFEYCEGDECEEDPECGCCCHHEEEEEHECCCHHHDDDHECCCHNDDYEEIDVHCRCEGGDHIDHLACCDSLEETPTRLTVADFEDLHHCDECDANCDGSCDGHCHDEEEEDEEECCHCDEHEHEHEDGCCCGHCHDEDQYYFDDLVQDLLTVYGYLYKNDYAKAKVFGEYIKNFLLEVALDFEKELDVNEAIENLEKNVYFQDIIKQFED